MKSVLILSRDKEIIDPISKAVQASGFEGKIQIVGSDTMLLVRLADLEHATPSAIFIDLAAAGDAIRLVEWLKLSSRTRKLRIVAIGEESTALKLIREGWGPATALTKPLDRAAMEAAVGKASLGAETQGKSRSEMLQQLVEAVERSKELRTQQEILIQHVDLLSAEIKDKKMPFKRSRKEEQPLQSRQESA